MTIVYFIKYIFNTLKIFIGKLTAESKIYICYKIVILCQVQGLLETVLVTLLEPGPLWSSPGLDRG